MEHTFETIKQVYLDKIEKIDTSKGYSLTAIKVKSGWLVSKWYERNQWSEPSRERRLLFHNNGFIFENNVKIGTYSHENSNR